MAPPPTYVLPLDTRPSIRMMRHAIHGTVVTEELWRLADVWCLHAYSYHADLCLDGRWLRILPGTVSLIAPGTVMNYRYRGRSPHDVAHFHLPREAGRRVSRRVPAIVPLRSQRGSFTSAFDQAIGYFSTSPLRAEVRLWDLLWQYVALADQQTPDIPPAVRKACEIIDARMGEPLRIAEIAEAVDLSHNQLTRLFRRHLNKTVIRYLRDRRVHLASHLLRETQLPIKSIAYHVGVPDLHHFNKMIRATLGRSPRQVRAEG